MKKIHFPSTSTSTLTLTSTSTFFLSLILLITSCNNNKTQTPTEKKPATDSIVTTTKKTIVFFGNSLTAGYGLQPDDAFPALIQNRLDAADHPYTVVNAGVSGETTAGGNGRINWILKQPIDIFVLELGANDGLRGIPPAETKSNLQSIIEKVKAKYPDVKIILAGMQIPPSMGSMFATEFKNIYPELAKKNNIPLIPFLLEGVGGELKLNQQDGIHPTKEGQVILAENVWKVLEPIL